MVKKKVKKVSRVSSKAKRSVSKSSSRKKSKPTFNSRIPKKMEIVGKRLIFFVIMFVSFLILNVAISNETWSGIFGMGSLIFGFISIALLIVYLTLWFMKLMKK